jgi:hypothetical protein
VVPDSESLAFLRCGANWTVVNLMKADRKMQPVFFLLLGCLICGEIRAESPTERTDTQHRATASGREKQSRLGEGIAGLLRPLCPETFETGSKRVPYPTSPHNLLTFDEITGIEQKSKAVLVLYALNRIEKQTGSNAPIGFGESLQSFRSGVTSNEIRIGQGLDRQKFASIFRLGKQNETTFLIFHPQFEDLYLASPDFMDGVLLREWNRQMNSNHSQSQNSALSKRALENEAYWTQVAYYRTLPKGVQRSDPRIAFMIDSASKGRDTNSWDELLDNLEGVDFALLDRLEKYRMEKGSIKSAETVIADLLKPLFDELQPDFDRLEKASDAPQAYVSDPHLQDQLRREFRRLSTFLSEVPRLVDLHKSSWEGEWKQLVQLQNRVAQQPILKQIIAKPLLGSPERSEVDQEATLSDFERWLKSDEGDAARMLACGKSIPGPGQTQRLADHPLTTPEIEKKIRAKRGKSFSSKDWDLLESIFGTWPKEVIKKKIIENDLLGLSWDDMNWVKVAYEARFGEPFSGLDPAALQRHLENYSDSPTNTLLTQATKVARSKLAEAFPFLSVVQRALLLDKFYPVRFLSMTDPDSWSELHNFFDHLPEGPDGDRFLEGVLPTVESHEPLAAAWIRMFKDFRSGSAIQLVAANGLERSIHDAIYDAHSRGNSERERFLAEVSTLYNEVQSTKNTNAGSVAQLEKLRRTDLVRVPIPDKLAIELEYLLGSEWESKLGARRQGPVRLFETPQDKMFWVETSALEAILSREDFRRRLSPDLASSLNHLPSELGKLAAGYFPQANKMMVVKNLINLLVLDPDHSPPGRRKSYWDSVLRIIKELPEYFSREERNSLFTKIGLNNLPAASDLSYLGDTLHFDSLRHSKDAQTMELEKMIRRMQQAAPFVPDADAWLKHNLDHPAVRALSQILEVDPVQARICFSYDDAGNLRLDRNRLALLAAPFSPKQIAKMANYPFRPPSEPAPDFREMQRQTLAGMTPDFKLLNHKGERREFAEFSEEFPRLMEEIPNSHAYVAQREAVLAKLKALPVEPSDWLSWVRFSKPVKGPLISNSGGAASINDFPPGLLPRYLSAAVDRGDFGVAMGIATGKKLKQGSRSYLFLRPIENPDGPVTILAWDSDDEGFSALQMFNGSAIGSFRSRPLSHLEPFIPDLSKIDVTKIFALKPKTVRRGGNLVSVLSPVFFGPTTSP